MAYPYTKEKLALKKEEINTPAEQQSDPAEIIVIRENIKEIAEIQKELGEIFLLYAKGIQGTLISVTNIRISPDLSIAKVYLSIFPSEKSKAILQNIQDSVKSIRFELGNRVRNQLRVIPELSFFIDDTLDYLENIDNLLKK